jgi:hypothetical protein
VEIPDFLVELPFSGVRNERVTLMSTVFVEKNVYYWCSTNKSLDRGLQALPWLPREPDNGYPPEGIMFFNYLNSIYGLADGNTFATWNYMCQWP